MGEQLMAIVVEGDRRPSLSVADAEHEAMRRARQIQSGIRKLPCPRIHAGSRRLSTA